MDNIWTQGLCCLGIFFFFFGAFFSLRTGRPCVGDESFLAQYNSIELFKTKKREKEHFETEFPFDIGYNVMQDCRLMASRYILCTDGEQPFIKTVIINQEMVSPWIDRITFTNQSDPNLKHQKSARQITFPLDIHKQKKKKKFDSGRTILTC